MDVINMDKDKEISGLNNLEFKIIFTIPKAALRKAKGSLEPLGITPTPKHPTKVSNRSAIPTKIPSVP